MPDLPVSDRCQIDADYDDWLDPKAIPLSACGERTIAVIIFACVHEHIDAAGACAGCTAEIERAADGLICRSCETGTDPHSCPQTISVRWLADTWRRP
jgi:predicted amidophosphoribosyltransferase